MDLAQLPVDRCSSPEWVRLIRCGLALGVKIWLSKGRAQTDLINKILLLEAACVKEVQHFRFLQQSFAKSKKLMLFSKEIRANLECV